MLVDVTLAADGVQIQAHKLVLAASSVYFQVKVHHAGRPIMLNGVVNHVINEDACTGLHYLNHLRFFHIAGSFHPEPVSAPNRNTEGRIY
jgi:hypothetical protein